MHEAYDELESRISCLTLSIRRKDLTHLDSDQHKATLNYQTVSLRAAENRLSSPSAGKDVQMLDCT